MIKHPVLLVILLAGFSQLLAQSLPSRPVYLSYPEVQPILEAMDEVLPEPLKGKTPEQQAQAWPAWIESHDREIRARLVQGDEDTMVNFLFFGMSFTSRPRLTPTDFKPVVERQSGAPIDSFSIFSPRTQEILEARITDLLQSLRNPGGNERLLFLRRLLESKGFKPILPTGSKHIDVFIRRQVLRVLNEQEKLATTLDAARLLADPSEEFVERSKLFKERGLSLDTSLLPNAGIEDSLKEMMARRLLAPGCIRRAAIVGPGLDFTDKQSGYDFYPQQTLQPFALIDSLLKLGLATPQHLEIVTLDLSPRVNDHLRRSRLRAQRGIPYVIQLPLDTTIPWKAGILQYWEHFGEHMGRAVPPVAVPVHLAAVKLRAVRVPASGVLLVSPEDVNIVAQHLDLPESRQFDLIIGTNIFVYYNVFEQTLAMANVERMLRPGGFLLSNNALLELPSSHVHSVGYHTVVYSDRPDDGDHIVWYQKTAAGEK